MKGFSELTKKGKYRRCKRAITILEMHCCSQLSSRIYDDLYGYIDTKDEIYLDDLRDKLLEENLYRGYTNFNPLDSVKRILVL